MKALKEQPFSQGLLGFEPPWLLAPAFPSEAGGFGVQPPHLAGSQHTPGAFLSRGSHFVAPPLHTRTPDSLFHGGCEPGSPCEYEPFVTFC